MSTHVLEEQLVRVSIIEMSDHIETLFCSMVIRQGNDPQTY